MTTACFQDFTISFCSLTCWDIVVSLYLVLVASGDPLKSCSLGCHALAFIYDCVSVTPPPSSVQPKVWILLQTIRIFHLFCCSLSSISLPPALVPSALSCCLWVCLALLLLPLTVELGCLRPDSPPPPPQRVGMYNANVPFKTRFCAHKFQDIVPIFVCLVGWALISV